MRRTATIGIVGLSAILLATLIGRARGAQTNRLLDDAELIPLVGGACPGTDCACLDTATCNGTGCDGDLNCTAVSDTLCLRLLKRDLFSCAAEKPGSKCTECQVNSCANEYTGTKAKNDPCTGLCTNPTPCGEQHGLLCADGANPSCPCGQGKCN